MVSLKRRYPCLRRAKLMVWLLGSISAAAAPSRPIDDSGCGGPGRQHTYDDDISAALDAVAPVWPMPPSFIKAVIQRESAFNPTAMSRAGAIGLMQVMPSNAARVGLSKGALWKPRENILAGVRLLAVLLRHYEGDVISALVAYNARPRPRLAPLPDNGETPPYVLAVLRAWEKFERCDASSAKPHRTP
jgi:soluble lytic murein transglycosylase-like protein